MDSRARQPYDAAPTVPRRHERCLDPALDSRLLMVLAAAGLGLWEWDFAHDTVLWDDLMAQLHGLGLGAAPTLEEFEALVHPSDREVALHVRRRGIEDGWFSYRYRSIHPDGSTVWIESGGRVFPDGDGAPKWFVGICKDVTREIERADTYRAVFENGVDALLLVNDERRFVDANAAAAHLFGRPVEELVGCATGELTGTPPEEAEEVWRRFMDARVVRGELPLVNGRGEEIVLDYRATADVAPGRHLVIARDITAQKELESALRQSQKMEAIGRLAGGIAHDFNNLLTAISGYAAFALGRSGAAADPELHDDLAEIRRAADRAASLTQQLLAFSRRQLLRPQAIDVPRAIEAAQGLISRLIGENIAVAVALDPSVGQIRADVSAVEQCLLNLAVNARDAMPAGGTLSIAVDNVEITEEWAGTHAEGRPGSYVRIAVSDTGVGMDDDTRARIFEPFFTTKEPGKGTGLGLATLYGIVRQSGGLVTVNSQPGRGTTFKLYFPRTDDAVAPPAVALDSPASGQGETVLLVEDDPIVRGLVCEMLRRSGYKPVAAADPVEALALLDSSLQIDVLLTDVVMPHMSGVELSRVVLERRPQVAIVYASGYTDAATNGANAIAHDLPFLQKPFSQEQLTAAVERALARRT